MSGRSRQARPAAAAATMATRRLLLRLPLLAAPVAYAAPAPRLVTLGGTVTEIVYALGAGDQVVGIDDSSFYPPAARRLPRVGYYRGFAVEGVVALGPDQSLGQWRKTHPQDRIAPSGHHDFDHGDA